MGLNFGFRPHEQRESIWREDDALDSVPEAALSQWKVDGDASHLRPYATKGTPAKVTFRTLTSDEHLMVTTRYYGAANNLESYLRMTLLCFRLAVDFPDAPTEITDARGVKIQRVVKEYGSTLLSDDFVRHIEHAYPGICAFYGGLVLGASLPTAAEKKASSQSPTPPPSSPTSGGQVPGAAA